MLLGMSQHPDLNQLRALATELMASLEAKEQALSLKTPNAAVAASSSA